jgi:predicted permease
MRKAKSGAKPAAPTGTTGERLAGRPKARMKAKSARLHFKACGTLRVYAGDVADALCGVISVDETGAARVPATHLCFTLRGTVGRPYRKLAFRPRPNVRLGDLPGVTKRCGITLSFGATVAFIEKRTNNVKERARAAGTRVRLGTLLNDLHFALRVWRKKPSVAIVSILSLALGIGATTAILSVMYGVLLKPFPYVGANRMVALNVSSASGTQGLGLSSLQFQALRRAICVDGASADDDFYMVASSADLPESVLVGRLSGNSFSFFGVPPLLGREFTPADAPDIGESDRVAVLSYHFWQSHYGGKRGALGQSLELDHQDYRVIGVLPPRFDWGGSDVYVPLEFSQDPNIAYWVVARLKPGITREAADAELQPLFDQFAAETPARYPPGFRVHLTSFRDQYVGSFTGTVFLLFGAVMAMLVIGCLNVAILLLASSVSRENEFAIRLALGAPQRRIVRQLFIESLVLSLAGGLLGILLAYVALVAFMRSTPPHLLPLEVRMTLNTPVLLTTLLVSVLTTIFFGLAPAAQMFRADTNRVLRGSARSIVSAVGPAFKHRILVTAQVAFGLVVLLAAAASALTYVSLYRKKLGYDPKNVLVLTTTLSEGTYTNWESRIAYYEQIRKSLVGMHGVESVGITVANIPPSRGFPGNFQVIGRSNEAGYSTVLEGVSPEYFQVLHIPLLRGASWSDTDDAQASNIAVINRKMAQQFWPDGDPIGQEVRLANLRPPSSWVLASPTNNGVVRIIGVVGDTQNDGLNKPVLPAIYVPYTLAPPDGMRFVLRTSVPPLTIVRAARERVGDVNASQPVSQVTTAEQQLAAQGWDRERFTAAILFVLAAMVLALFLVGLYSVLSYEVSRRNREFGIRMALGAPRAHVIWLVLRSAVGVLSVGMACGLLGALAVGHAVSRWTETSLVNPLVLGGVCAVLIVASAVATVVPAYRAVSTNPMQSLRSE